MESLNLSIGCILKQIFLRTAGSWGAFIVDQEGNIVEKPMDDEDTARKLGFQTICWVSAGGVITTHGGPGALAIAGYSATTGKADHDRH